MKKYSKLMAVLLVVAMLLPGIAQAAPAVTKEDVHYVTVIDLNLRTRNDDTASPVVFVPEGEKVLFTGEKTDNGYFSLEYNGKEGYAHRGDVTSEENYNSNDKTIHDIKLNEKSNGKSYRVVQNISLRTGNGKQYRSVELMVRDGVVKHLGTTENGWFKVNYDGQDGYVYRGDVTGLDNSGSDEIHDIELVEKANNKTYVAIVDLALRTGNGKQYKAIGLVERGQEVTHLGATANGWFKVDANGTVGYVYRGDLTSRANYDDLHEEVELEVESVKVIDEVTLEVELTDGTVHTVTLETALKDNVKTEVTFEIDGNEYTATVTYVAKGLKVESVSAINATQLVVKFNTEVGDDATAYSSYTVTDLNTATTNQVDAIEVLEDGKSVRLSLQTPYRVSTDLAVVVDGVYKKGSIKDTFPRFAQTVTVNDTKLPEIVSATSKTNTSEAQMVTVILSEPVKNTTLFKVNGKTVSSTPIAPAVERATNDETVATTYLLSGIELETGKTHTVEMINAEDYADNKSDDIITKSFTVTQDTVAASGQVSQVQDNKIKVKFDKAITQASLSNVKLFVYNESTPAFDEVTVDNTVKADAAGKEWIFDIDTDAAGFYTANNSTQDVLVRVLTGVIDTAGNQVKTFDSTVTLTHDTVGPELQSVTFDKNSKGEVTKLYFKFDELLSTIGSDSVTKLANANIVVTDKSNNNVVAFEDLFGTANTATLATDEKTLIVTVDPATADVTVVTNGVVTSGSYDFKLVGGTTHFVVKDDAVDKNENKEKNVTVNFGNTARQVVATVSTDAIFTAGGAPDYTGTTADAQDITVTFSKPVTAASAINPANYSFAGKTLPSDTIIVYDEANSQAEFTLPMDYIAKSDSQAVIQIRNIKPIDSSYVFKTYSDVLVAIDNTRPVATTSIVATGEIKLSFKEMLDVTVFTGDVKADFASLKINGKTINAAEYSITAGTDTDTGLSIATVTVDAKVDTVDGFTYQYIDVDNDGSYNPTADIQLRRASGTTAPASWADDNGIAKLNLGNITSVELKTTANPSLVVDENGTASGNAIKKDTVIKVK